MNTVYNLAVVSVNGGKADTLWTSPFSADITPYVHQGANHIRIKVINLWPNQIIGDRFLPFGERYTHTNVIKLKRDSPLLPSGLIGPVVIKFKPGVGLE